MIRLAQLLTYLSRIEVSEIVVGSGRPVTIRSAGAYKPLTSAPVTTGQILELVRGTELEALIPAQDSSGTPRDISLGGGIYRATIARRGDAVFVKIERAEEANPRESDRLPIDKPPRVVERNATQIRDPEARDRGPHARTMSMHPTPVPVTPQHGTMPLAVVPGAAAASAGPGFTRPGSSSGNHDVRVLGRGSTPEQPVPPSSPGIVIDKGPRLPPAFARQVPELFVALVREARRRNATDVHVAAGQPPMLRTVGQLHPGNAPLDAEAVQDLLEPLLSPAEHAALGERGHVDLAIDVRDPQLRATSRVRGTIARARHGLRGAIRLVWDGVPTLEALHLPAALARVASFRRGLVVVAGPRGHGKTTTMAALVDVINASQPHHIVTVEDPIEIVHPRKQGLVSQRALGAHTLSYAAAVTAALREDPDVIAIGEVRDRETVELALTAVEAGHLVLCTVAAPSAARTLDRMIEMFPPADQPEVRAAIAAALRMVVGQRLVPARAGDRRVPAVELLAGAHGTIRLDDALHELVRDGMIDEATALAHAEDPRALLPFRRGKLDG
ncbi:MAG: Flp pilus assembly complex ATPase component TadA [Deltaproteobacteria bacterium]|nr:Flp pilus assembly complex ATPase component TadA [Deltaproteobacteria bacterium]